MAAQAPDPELDKLLFEKTEEAGKGIPKAIFIEDVEGICTGRKPTDVVARLQDLHSKYQYMSSSITTQRAGLKAKLPDLAQALETVNHLVEKRDTLAEGESSEYTYQLAENIWAKAAAPATKTVCLWVGANCMLEYTLEEAVELLTTNEVNAKRMLEGLDNDMAFLRDQITTTEVNIARCHNHGVKQRQAEKEKQESEEAKKPKAAAYTPPARAPEPEDTRPFHWKQDKEEVEVSVKLPAEATKEKVKVTILAESLKVEHDGKIVFEGRFAGKVSPNGSTWTMGKGRVDVSLEKTEAEQWPSLFEES